MIKKILLAPVNFVKLVIKGEPYVCDFISRGFFFYFVMLFKMIGKIIPFNFIKKVELFFRKMQEESLVCMLILLYSLIFNTGYTILYKEKNIVKVDENLKTEIVKDNDKTNEDKNTDNNEIIKINKESNLYKKYGKMSLSDVNINSLKDTNEDTFGWISVDGTNINYPVVLGFDNEFYLDHSFDKSFKMTGWIFMDYRNTINLDDDNTIIYGHNLLNYTGFGSISNIFTDEWLNNSNHKIVILTESNRYVYEIFSAYYTDVSSDYLITNFNNDAEKEKFLDDVKNKSIVKFNNVKFNSNSKIITLSTCTDDNSGRKVVHALLKE